MLYTSHLKSIISCKLQGIDFVQRDWLFSLYFYNLLTVCYKGQGYVFYSQKCKESIFKPVSELSKNMA